ncbi:HlyD family efflux transporter periplasmic adaptor subunit [Testudinibacter sp. TR-2022]|uniref:HlyD family efflux transporter periplasmic adaptor subunit n=2 Tax=Testudinibacter sp. TR-2022 TaxID=2585029 RepID=UPI001118C79D|nr:HlyD family efflux transporter periplasmic adaptor subunit [Testudinibacter sp. TR-2022]TNH06260.1 HlyD family efflux transporter periplasmic adaptor subunit [Testudinibacter sp. TR-2022]
MQAKLIQQKIIISNLDSEMITQDNQIDSEILKYHIQKDELNIKLMEIKSITEIIINSPINGRVEAIHITSGQSIHENSPLLQISPSQKREYKLVFWIPSDGMPYISIGEKIKVRYDAFPYEKFGQFNGIIESISAIPASSQELSFYKNAPLNADPNNPLYKVIVNIEQQQIDYDKKTLLFTDGMRAEATVFLEKRPLYQWIFLPFYSLQKNLISESAEYGLASLAMVLNYYQDSSDLFSLRRRYHISAKGTNLKELSKLLILAFSMINFPNHFL